MDDREPPERLGENDGDVVKTRNKRILWVFVVVQLSLLAIVAFGDFGFYFAGIQGDLNDLAKWIFGYLLVLAAGVIAAVGLRENRFVIIQLAIPLLAVLGVATYLMIDIYFSTHEPRPPDLSN